MQRELPLIMSCGAARQPVLTHTGEEVTDDIRRVNEMQKDRERIVGAPATSSAIFKE
jgi:hypothetical protein